jgi:hypothetical protein
MDEYLARQPGRVALAIATAYHAFTDSIGLAGPLFSVFGSQTRTANSSDSELLLIMRKL